MFHAAVDRRDVLRHSGAPNFCKTGDGICTHDITKGGYPSGQLDGRSNRCEIQRVMTFAYHKTPDPHEPDLTGHDHWLLTELSGPWTAAGGPLSVEENNGHWSRHVDHQDHSGEPALTGRFRSGCSCGWRSKILDATKTPAWYYRHVTEPDFTGLRPADVADDLAEHWTAHIATVASAQIGLDAITDAVAQVAAANTAVDDAVAAARQAGRSWAQIARRLGCSKQAAWERYGP